VMQIGIAEPDQGEVGRVPRDAPVTGCLYPKSPAVNSRIPGPAEIADGPVESDLGRENSVVGDRPFAPGVDVFKEAIFVFWFMRQHIGVQGSGGAEVRGWSPTASSPHGRIPTPDGRHFQGYNDVVGDHPSNLSATTLALNAYMLTHEPKYKKWLLEYVDAWRERAIANDGILPSKSDSTGPSAIPAGPGMREFTAGTSDTSTPSPADSSRGTRPTSPDRARQCLSAHRRRPLPRRLAETNGAINSHAQVVDGRTLYPHMYGAQDGTTTSRRPTPWEQTNSGTGR